MAALNVLNVNHIYNVSVSKRSMFLFLILVDTRGHNLIKNIDQYASFLYENT